LSQPVEIGVGDDLVANQHTSDVTLMHQLGDQLLVFLSLIGFQSRQQNTVSQNLQSDFRSSDSGFEAFVLIALLQSSIDHL